MIIANIANRRDATLKALLSLAMSFSCTQPNDLLKMLKVFWARSSGFRLEVFLQWFRLSSSVGFLKIPWRTRECSGFVQIIVIFGSLGSLGRLACLAHLGYLDMI